MQFMNHFWEWGRYSWLSFLGSIPFSSNSVAMLTNTITTCLLFVHRFCDYLLRCCTSRCIDFRVKLCTALSKEECFKYWELQRGASLITQNVDCCEVGVFLGVVMVFFCGRTL